ncbi:MAG: N-formylglutamate deformylase [Gammaproteobacteria bacterium]|jgi:N-formylglutamate amidohydrolase|nr:N-formylglutamate deformylase [Gammaproteobacteria bacterium]
MTDVFSFTPGNTPLLISVPHDGRQLPDDLRERMTPEGIGIPDTDWHVAALYDFASEIGANVLVARYSRYVVDLNRPASDDSLYEGQVATGLCPTQTFAGENIYRSSAVEADEMARRIETYWRPYHEKIEQEIERLRARFGFALLWDAHSIAGVVPRLFDGELPALNIGSNNGESCARNVEQDVVEAARASPFESVVNGRFKGGYITRHYGDPDNNVHALQLEIAQRTYMDENTRVFDTSLAGNLRETLRRMLTEFLRAAAS